MEGASVDGRINRCDQISSIVDMSNASRSIPGNNNKSNLLYVSAVKHGTRNDGSRRKE